LLLILGLNIIGDDLRDSADPPKAAAPRAAPAQTGGDVMAEKLLQVKHLEVNFATRQGVISPVRGVSFEVHAHETLGIIGESGCGKSVTAQALMLLSPRTTRVEGEVVLAGRRYTLSPGFAVSAVVATWR
jgi:ABC-type transport system involved in cytochrome bd biosynthesis fused ATPase/permease subunit